MHIKFIINMLNVFKVTINKLLYIIIIIIIIIHLFQFAFTKIVHKIEFEHVYSFFIRLL